MPDPARLDLAVCSETAVSRMTGRRLTDPLQHIAPDVVLAPESTPLSVRGGD